MRQTRGTTLRLLSDAFGYGLILKVLVDVVSIPVENSTPRLSDGPDSPIELSTLLIREKGPGLPKQCILLATGDQCPNNERQVTWNVYRGQC